MERRDLLFLIETLIPDHGDKGSAADAIRSDEQLIDAMLNEDQLFRRLVSEDDALILVSPWLFFTVLLRRVRRDLERESFTVERRHLQNVLLFDVDRVVELLEQESLQDYLAAMLASFTRVESVTVPIRVQKGTWRRYRTSDLDVDGMMCYSQALAEPFRFEPYRRVADVCLFLAGMFPEHIEAEYRYPLSQRPRPRARGRICVRLEDYEAHGRAFYQLAAEHERARVEGLDDVLTALSENFVLAEKPLAFLANRYLQFTRYGLFET